MPFTDAYGRNLEDLILPNLISPKEKLYKQYPKDAAASNVAVNSWVYKMLKNINDQKTAADEQANTVYRRFVENRDPNVFSSYIKDQNNMYRNTMASRDQRLLALMNARANPQSQYGSWVMTSLGRGQKPHLTWQEKSSDVSSRALGQGILAGLVESEAKVFGSPQATLNNVMAMEAPTYGKPYTDRFTPGAPGNTGNVENRDTNWINSQSPEQKLAWYREDLKRYNDTIAIRDAMMPEYNTGAALSDYFMTAMDLTPSSLLKVGTLAKGIRAAKAVKKAPITRKTAIGGLAGAAGASTVGYTGTSEENRNALLAMAALGGSALIGNRMLPPGAGLSAIRKAEQAAGKASTLARGGKDYLVNMAWNPGAVSKTGGLTRTQQEIEKVTGKPLGDIPASEWQNLIENDIALVVGATHKPRRADSNYGTNLAKRLAYNALPESIKSQFSGKTPYDIWWKQLSEADRTRIKAQHEKPTLEQLQEYSRLLLSESTTVGKNGELVWKDGGQKLFLSQHDLGHANPEGKVSVLETPILGWVTRRENTREGQKVRGK